MQNATPSPPMPRPRTGAHPVVAPGSAPSAPQMDATTAALLRAALSSLPPGSVAYILLALLAAVAVWGAQLSRIWGLPGEVDAMRGDVHRIGCVVGALSPSECPGMPIPPRKDVTP